ncbi:hypothetical protein FDH66_gp49 [Arthrobacter phage Amigo]|uniref:Uncharacterized protein n=5 Tax=Amigovirus amigo TaxID=1982100 RepID=A0A5J6TF23_9CAUD|nr:hypothetical protein FDH66_gp49 [Arthrobacter phage Amigo]QFG08347.1 hypothetical protein SEA_YEEZUS_54 [Arthrobacter phage Yeezus]QFG13396.1 hypothetical protein SEA_ICHOR_54 [Arthrobacter phage Ichor]QFG13914.1 hypothetical protein SEA_JAEK_54 [Arthrobacter phage Jaek]QJD51701.1 hypothetical protein SEA_BOERSMA_56 [Arthrobacter phage Boersma]ALY08404.1 hypothetical protein AMIGO_54 [Arthrobacter phage Amigo]
MDNNLPAGWRVTGEWVPEVYEVEFYYFVETWGTRDERKHWWTKKRPVTGWRKVHRERRKELAEQWAFDTIRAMGATNAN